MEYGLATDNKGNVITTGFYLGGAIDFDPGPGICILNSTLAKTLFVRKLNFAGEFCWAKELGFPDDYDINPKGMVLDVAGNIYITGAFEGTIDFDPGPSSYPLSSIPSNTACGFILKLDNDGNFIWARKMGQHVFNYVQYIYSNALAIDPEQHLLISGSFSGTEDFDPGPGVFMMNATSGCRYVMKLDTNGNFIRAFQTGTNDESNSAHNWGIHTDNVGNIYLSGIYSGIVDFDPGAGIAQDTVTSLLKRFIAKYDTGAHFQWVRTWHYSVNSSYNDFAADLSGNLFLSGSIEDSLDIDPGPAVSWVLPPATGSRHFMLKLDHAGNLKWFRTLDFATDYYWQNINTDRDGCLYASGAFTDTVDFDPETPVSNLTAAAGIYENFLLKIGQEGSLIWAITNGGNESPFNLGNIFIDPHDNIHSIGNLEGTRDFDPDTAILNLSGFTEWDMFTQRLWQCPPTEDSLVLESCLPVVMNGEEYASSGVYKQFLTSAAGCDSILILNVTIQEIDNTVLLSGATLSVTDSSLSCQWIDCDNGFAAVQGQNASTFTPLSNGNFAVILGNGLCTDTSACFSVVTIGIPLNEIQDPFQIYPNPNHGKFSLVIAYENFPLMVEIRNIHGQLIYKEEIVRAGVSEISIQSIPGLYWVALNDSDKTLIRKVVVQ